MRVNPGEFSYARYLKQKNVHHELIPLTPVEQKGHSYNFISYFHIFRERLLQKTFRLTRDSTCRILINTLCLGYKNNSDSELQQLFINTGTIHLLSVSGLHTGAIYLLIFFLFKHIGLTGKKTELGILPLLWCYACLTGLSPSVIRASTILSFLTIGKAFSRTNNPINSLAAAAFFTLLLQPMALYSLSFLLSYSAYAGILTIYPLLFRLPGSLPWILSKIYACCCVTLAAQIPTLPISAFFFHTINLNGFLANLIAVPLATLLLYSSAICLLFPIFVGKYLIFLCETLCKALVYFLKIFVPYSINIRELYPSFVFTLILYGCLISLGILLIQKKQYWLKISIFMLTILLGYQITRNITLSSQREIAIFHYYKQSAILLNYKGHYIFLKNSTSSLEKTKPYIQQNKLKPLLSVIGVLENNLYWDPPSLYSENDTILLLETNHSHYYPCDILIITDDLPPEKIFPGHSFSVYPQLIIADGSNNKYTLQKWDKFCYANQISFQDTSKEGFISLSLK